MTADKKTPFCRRRSPAHRLNGDYFVFRLFDRRFDRLFDRLFHGMSRQNIFRLSGESHRIDTVAFLIGIIRLRLSSSGSPSR